MAAVTSATPGVPVQRHAAMLPDDGVSTQPATSCHQQGVDQTAQLQAGQCVCMSVTASTGFRKSGKKQAKNPNDISCLIFCLLTQVNVLHNFYAHKCHASDQPIRWIFLDLEH